MNQVTLEKGSRFVGMPHSSIYASLWQIAPMLSDAHKEVKNHDDMHGDWLTGHGSEKEKLKGRLLYNKKVFLSSSGRIYPALYFEAYANFLATFHSLEYKKDFDRLSTPKKLSIYTYLITGKHLRPEAAEFVKKLVKMRDAEVHQKPTVGVIGNEQNRKYDFFSPTLHQCSLFTILKSMGVLVEEIQEIFESSGKSLPQESLMEFEVPTCHREQNKYFVLRPAMKS